MKRISPVLAILAALVLPACEPGSGNSGPTAEEKAQTRRAASGNDAASQTMKIGSDAVIDSGSDGAAAKTRAGRTLATVTTFDYAEAVDVTLDLDMLDGGGQDAFPNATGSLRIQAAGTVNGTNTAGNAVYAVQTEWLTDGVFTDPVSGCTVTIAEGSGLSWSLTFSWNWIAENNWTISGTNDYSGNHTVTVEHGGETWTVIAMGERHAGVVLTQTPAGFAAGGAVSGHVEITVTGPDGTHTVVFDWAGVGLVTVTCDGEVHGPYAIGVAKVVFGCEID